MNVETTIYELNRKFDSEIFLEIYLFCVLSVVGVFLHGSAGR